MDLGTVFGMVGVIAIPASIGVGFGMSGASPGEYFFAKVCFWITAAGMTGAVFMLERGSLSTLTLARLLWNGLAGAAILVILTSALNWVEIRQSKSPEAAMARSTTSTGVEQPQAQGGKGGGGEIFGSGTVIGGAGGRVGAGGTGRGGDGGSGVIHGNGVVIGGQGGPVDGTEIWYPPAASGGDVMPGGWWEPDYGAILPGQGGMSPGYLARFQVATEIRQDYFAAIGMNEKLKSSKIGDVPLEFLNKQLKEKGYPWRARVEGRWYVFFIPHE